MEIMVRSITASVGQGVVFERVVDVISVTRSLTSSNTETHEPFERGDLVRLGDILILYRYRDMRLYFILDLRYCYTMT